MWHSSSKSPYCSLYLSFILAARPSFRLRLTGEPFALPLASGLKTHFFGVPDRTTSFHHQFPILSFLTLPTSHKWLLAPDVPLLAQVGGCFFEPFILPLAEAFHLIPSPRPCLCSLFLPILLRRYLSQFPFNQTTTPSDHLVILFLLQTGIAYSNSRLKPIAALVPSI